MIQPALQHANEPVNHRSLLLRLRRTIWLVPLMTLAGALLGALIYGVVWLSVSGQRQYEQTSKYYLTFGYEENGEVADYYNAYTWNDLIFSITAISDVIEDELPDGVSMEEAQEAIEADILSDVRLLTITVTYPDANAVQQMTNAVEDALVRYGDNVTQFESIEFLSSSEVEAVVVSDRTRNAVLLGALLGFLISAMWVWIRELLDDGIYVPEDAVRRYGIPVSVILAAEGSELPAFLAKETKEALQALAASNAARPVRLVCEDTAQAKETAEILRKQFEVLSGEKDDTPDAAGGEVLLVIPFGRANGTQTEHLIERLRAQGDEVDSIVLTGADGKYLAQYYGTNRKRKS